jgi:iron complex transport system substrate-binding protein
MPRAQVLRIKEKEVQKFMQMPRFRVGALSLILFVSLCCGSEDKPSARVESLRIVSLSPAITEILFDVGLGDAIVGVSAYCILPKGQKRKVVGNMVTVDTEAVLSCKPTHLFFQGPAERLQNLVRFDPKIRLESFQLETISDILLSIKRIGDIMKKPRLAEKAISEFKAKIQAVSEKTRSFPKKRVAFILSMGSYDMMAAGPDTFIDELITAAGGINTGRDLPGKQRWRKTNTESLLATKPEILICQIDPQQSEARELTRQKWSGYIDQPQLGLKRVEVVDDRRWTFPSTHIADLADRLATIIRRSID